MSTSKPVVLITGCSTGIGRALAEEFHRRGCSVYATARQLESLPPLAGLGIKTLSLDVNDPESVRQVMQTLQQAGNRLDILVNNAGFAAMGPIVEMEIEQLRRQFETNVFSVLAMVQTALPLLLASRQAKVVNIGSVSGILVSPFAGAYCASKSALHALSDALRIELSPFGIRVITVQPGAIRSHFGATASRLLSATLKKNSLYLPIKKAIDDRAMASQVNPTPTDEFARLVVEKIMRKNPPVIVRSGRGCQGMPLLKRLLPERLLDRILAKKFGLNILARQDQSPGSDTL
jgi:NAD(P)-dependent dehydrogenase (short-subunit alcohol dehydrogenase family)